MKRVASMLLTAVLVAGCTGAGGQPSVPNDTATDSPEAFHGLGRLAFIQAGTVYILDGETDTVRPVDGFKGAQAVA